MFRRENKEQQSNNSVNFGVRRRRWSIPVSHGARTMEEKAPHQCPMPHRLPACHHNGRTKVALQYFPPTQVPKLVSY